MFIIYNIFFTLLYLLLWTLAKLCLFFKLDVKFANAMTKRKASPSPFGATATGKPVLSGMLSSDIPMPQFCHARKVILVHSASMGEFEQVKPVIEKIKNEQPDIKIICSFYSPSGYETQKQYEFADIVCYLPSDTYFAAKKFIETIKPDLAIFVRYDLWYNHLKILKLHNIPVLLINATFPSSLHKNFIITSAILKYFYKKHFDMVDYIYAISETEYYLFKSLKLKTNLIISSDTRNDRILQKVHESQQNPIWNKELFSNNELVLVAGSVWNKDVDIINSAMKLYETWRQNDKHLKKIRLIFVPHEPTKKNVDYVRTTTMACPWTPTQHPWQQGNLSPSDSNVSSVNNMTHKHAASTSLKIAVAPPGQADNLVVNKVGYLLRLYGIADLAFVGGGFGVGVHSITEPAGYGLPIVAGANCNNSPFAKPLMELNAMTVIEEATVLANWLKKMNSESERNEIATRARQYIQSQSGTTGRVFALIIKTLKLAKQSKEKCVPYTI